MENLILPESFLLLALDDDKGNFVIDSNKLYYGIAGALLLELMLLEKLELEKKKKWFGLKTVTLIRATDDEKLENNILNKAYSIVKSYKEGISVKSLIETLGSKKNDFKGKVIEKLKNEGIIEEEKNKFLWVIPRTHYPESNPKPENEVRKRLHSIIFGETQYKSKDLMLLGLIYQCELTKEVFGKRYKEAKQKLKELTKEEEISKMVGQIIEEIYAAVIAATAGAVAATAAAGN